MRAVCCLLMVLSACADDKIHHLSDGCTAGDFTMEVTDPATYTCHQPFTSTLKITNDSCDTITIQSIELSGMTTTANCTPAPPGTFSPTTANVDPLQSTVVLDFTGNPFCCLPPGCPATFQCDETFTYVATTTTGATITGTAMSHLSLDGCDVICP